MNEQTPQMGCAAGDGASPAAKSAASIEQMRDALKDIFDPEIPINIVDLGLIYKLEEKDSRVEIHMTLTSPNCPVAEQIKTRVEEVLRQQPGITAIKVNLVFDPPWSKERMTFDGKLQASMLGIM